MNGETLAFIQTLASMSQDHADDDANCDKLLNLCELFGVQPAFIKSNNSPDYLVWGVTVTRLAQHVLASSKDTGD